MRMTYDNCLNRKGRKGRKEQPSSFLEKEAYVFLKKSPFAILAFFAVRPFAAYYFAPETTLPPLYVVPRHVTLRRPSASRIAPN
jgi:hypothetical protein